MVKSFVGSLVESHIWHWEPNSKLLYKNDIVKKYIFNGASGHTIIYFDFLSITWILAFILDARVKSFVVLTLPLHILVDCYKVSLFCSLVMVILWQYKLCLVFPKALALFHLKTQLLLCVCLVCATPIVM